MIFIKLTSNYVNNTLVHWLIVILSVMMPRICYGNNSQMNYSFEHIVSIRFMCFKLAHETANDSLSSAWMPFCLFVFPMRHSEYINIYIFIYIYIYGWMSSINVCSDAMDVRRRHLKILHSKIECKLIVRLINLI